MHCLYNLLVYLAAPLVLCAEAWQDLRAPAGRSRLAQRLGFGARLAPGAIWVHAVSVGEVQASAPLVRELLRRHPGQQLVLSTVTVTGAARARLLFGDAVALRFMPLDLPGAVRRFLDRIQPSLGVIVETELWPNLFAGCRRRDVPLVLGSARLSPLSVTRYRRLASLFGRALSGDVTIAAQSEQDAARFESIGAAAGRTCVTGNIKFDFELQSSVRAQGAAWRRREAASRPVWVAGSTHEGEEDVLLDAHVALRRRLPGALLVLVPRHPQRFDAVAERLERRGLRMVRRSGGAALTGDTEVLLGDTMGELMVLYAGADVAFVGGSLVPVGGHNLLEPAALGLPIVAGPYNFNGQEIHDKLAEAGALRTVVDAGGLAAELDRLLRDSEARREQGARGLAVIEQNRGAVARLLAVIDRIAGTDGAARSANTPTGRAEP